MKKNKLIVLLPIIFLTGCGIWTNFTTYFNRYYNTKKSFDLAIEELKNAPRELFEFKEPNAPSKASSEFKKVIEKGSKLLQFNANSSYVSDALYMTGVAFYYNKEYSKGLRKFKELLNTNDPEYLLKTQLWIAKCELQLRNFDRGVELLENTKKKARDSEEEETLIDIYIAQIRYLKYTNAYETAVVYGQELLEVSDDDELNAEITYELGKMYVINSNLEQAEIAFQRVNDFDPTYIIEFNSLLELSKIKKTLGKYDEALELLEDMKGENKFEEFGDIIGLEIGLIYLEQDNVNDSYNELTIVDTTYKTTESAGIAAYYRAEIWEQKYLNYDSAMIYFDRAIKSKAPNEYKVRARKKATVYVQLIKLQDDLHKKNKQLLYLQKPEIFIQDSLDWTLTYGKDSLKNEAEKNKLSEQIGGNRIVRGRRDQRTRRPTNTNNISQAIKARENHPRPKRPTVSADSLILLSADNKFQIGNLFFSELESPDSAYKYYNDLIENYPPDKNRPKIVFALGSYYLTQNDTTRADSVFNFVYENYQGDPVATEAAVYLGLKIVGEKDLAEEAYLRAEATYDSSKFNTAADEFYNIYKNFKESTLAPQALYTSGWIYENDIEDYKTAFERYDSLVSKYKNSIYAREVMPRYSMYKSELKRVQDSLNAISKAINDSLNIVDSSATQIPDSLKISQPAVNDSLKNSSKNLESKKTDKDILFEARPKANKKNNSNKSNSNKKNIKEEDPFSANSVRERYLRVKNKEIYQV